MIYTTMEDLTLQRILENTNYYTCPWCGNTMCFLKDNDPPIKGCMVCGNAFTAKGTMITRDDKGIDGILFIGTRGRYRVRYLVSHCVVGRLIKERGIDQTNNFINKEAVQYIDDRLVRSIYLDG